MAFAPHSIHLYPDVDTAKCYEHYGFLEDVEVRGYCDLYEYDVRYHVSGS